MAREDAVARELGQPPDEDLVERVAVRRDERVLRARPGEGADLGPRVDGRQPQAPRRVPELYRAVGGAAARREAAPRVMRDQASAFTAAPWPWSSWAPAPSFDADQTRTALSLPPVRISIAGAATPSSRRRVDGVRSAAKYDGCTGRRPSPARRRPATSAGRRPLGGGLSSAPPSCAERRAPVRRERRVDGAGLRRSRVGRNAIAATARLETLDHTSRHATPRSREPLARTSPRQSRQPTRPRCPFAGVTTTPRPTS